VLYGFAGEKAAFSVRVSERVVADSFWQAKAARDAVRIDWDEGWYGFSTSQMMQQFREQAKSPGTNFGAMAIPMPRSLRLHKRLKGFTRCFTCPL
jgi:hypothetical protein